MNIRLKAEHYWSLVASLQSSSKRLVGAVGSTVKIMAVNYFSVFFSIVVLTIISQRGKLVDSTIYSDHFINRWTKSTSWDLLDRDDLTSALSVCIESRVDGLLGLHCIKDSGECKKGWITNNQYWSNWNKIWIQLHYEDGGNRRNLLEQSREPATNSTDIWRRRCGIWTPGGGYSLMRA